jgi:hypothetical protein
MPRLLSPRVIDNSCAVVYFVLDDFGGRIGRERRETSETDTDRTVLIRHLLEGQYASPVRVIAFNTAADWSRHRGDRPRTAPAMQQ